MRTAADTETLRPPRGDPAQRCKPAEPAKPVEAVIAKVLRVGFLVSAFVITAGLVVQQVEVRGGVPRGSGSVAGPRGYPKGLSPMIAGLGHYSGSSVLEVGLWLLVCTPAAAMVTAAVAYQRRGDRRIAWLAFGVVGVLIASCIVGLLDL